jgi:nicotinamide mononucleotide (NMN) deamidase PncC
MKKMCCKATKSHYTQNAGTVAGIAGPESEMKNCGLLCERCAKVQNTRNGVVGECEKRERRSV